MEKIKKLEEILSNNRFASMAEKRRIEQQLASLKTSNSEESKMDRIHKMACRISVEEATLLVKHHNTDLPTEPTSHERLLESGAKLVMDCEGNYQIVGYAHDGSDVDQMVNLLKWLKRVVGKVGSITVLEGKKYEVGVRLMQQDSFRMGKMMGDNVFLLFSTHSTERMKYLIVVDTESGDSVTLEFPRKEGEGK